MKKRFVRAGTFTILIILLWPPLLALAKNSGAYSTVLSDESRYVDKYFTVHQDGSWQMNIYLGEQKLATVDNLGKVNYFLTDHLDSVVAMLNESGEVLESNDYEAFGAVNYSQGDYQDYKFLGQTADRENGWGYFQNRYYSYDLARFMSIDPLLLGPLAERLSQPQSLNNYSYALNNPLINIDPNGLETKVFIEKNGNWSTLDGWYGHAFLGIDGLIYNWDYNAGRRYDDNDDRFGGEDIDITTWENYSKRPANQSKDYHVYTFDTDKAQEREIRRYYLELGEANGQTKSEDRTLYSLFFNGVDAVTEALKRGGIISQNFSAGWLVSTASNLQKALDFRVAIQERGRPDFWQYYKRVYRNKIWEYITDRTVIKSND